MRKQGVMELIAHRINTLAGLAKLPREFGAEIDIRAAGSELILHHEPHEAGDRLVDFLDAYSHGTLVLNIKESGVEDAVLQLVDQRGLGNQCFLLDVEIPWLYRAAQAGERRGAVRYSEVEPLGSVAAFAGQVDWVWIDCFTSLPLDAEGVAVLRDFKTCLVCPERWGRPEDIVPYRQHMATLDFEPDAVMTAERYRAAWTEGIGS